MPKLDSIIFDLDGTLWDTCTACAVAWNNVLKRRGIKFPRINATDVRNVTGKPHETCIRETFASLPETEIQALIEDTMIEDNKIIEKLGGQLYDGVESGIPALAKKVPLFIVSNCQTGYVETFYRLSGLGGYFKDFECWGNTGNSKTENLGAVIKRNKLTNPIFVGDAEGDRAAARSCGVPFYFAEYGFGKVLDYDASFSAFGAFTNSLFENSLI